MFTILYAFAMLGINYTGYYVNELTVQNVPHGQALCLEAPYAFPKFGKQWFHEQLVALFSGNTFYHAFDE